MPYRDPERQRRAQLEYANARRQEWLAAQSCARCGSGGDLSVFGAAKGAFTSSAPVREAKLAGATVLCHRCRDLEREARAAAARQRRYERAAERRRRGPGRSPARRSRPARAVTPGRSPGPGAVEPRLPCAPLEKLSGLPAPVVAIRAGFTRSMGHKWRARGLSVDQADVAAIAAGLHPVLVWPEWELAISG